jgi:hypothetical protein
MAVDTDFQTQIDLVDDTKTLVFTVDALNYDENEWSYDGLEITGHDDFALDAGASELLYQMGFRFYGPGENFIKRPESIPTNLTQAKTQYWLPYTACFLAYGFDARFGTKTALNNNFNAWRRLNFMFHDRLPAGHRWKGIVADNSAFFAANQDLILNYPSDFLNLSVTGDRYEALTSLCAAYLLSEGLNSANRTHFDPADGDGQNTNLVWQFAADTVAKMRTGTAAIDGYYAAQDGVADAQVGVYIYAAHRNPPDGTDYPGVFALLALAFNQTSYSYLELCTLFGQKMEFVALRDYFDTMVWSMGVAQGARRMVRGYFNVYDRYRTAGALGTRGEFQANWLVNIVGMNSGIRVFRTGGDAGTLYDTVLDEMVDDIFGGDQAVHDLLTLWGSGYVTFNKYSLKIWADHVDDMTDETWYKTYFQQYIVIMYEYLNCPSQDDTVNFPIAFASLMSKVHAVSASDFFHSYAFERRLANGNVKTTYPALWMYANPLPDWISSATAPTEGEFDAHYAALIEEATRPDGIDSDDLVMVKFPSAINVGGNLNGEIRTDGTSTFCFVGPGTACFRADPSGVVTTIDYGPGYHIIAESFGGVGYAYATNGGKIFVYCFPTFDFATISSSTLGGPYDLYLYIPAEVDGAVAATALESRLTLRWASGSGNKVDIVSGGPTEAQQLLIPTGEVQIFYLSSGTRGNCEFGNVNPWLSPYPGYALMSRDLAERDFTPRVEISVPAFAATDDRTDPDDGEDSEETDE